MIGRTFKKMRLWLETEFEGLTEGLLSPWLALWPLLQVLGVECETVGGLDGEQ